MGKSDKEIAEDLLEAPLKLIKQILTKHHIAIVEQLHDEVKNYKSRIAELQAVVNQQNEHLQTIVKFDLCGVVIMETPESFEQMKDIIEYAKQHSEKDAPTISEKSKDFSDIDWDLPYIKR